jgi:hypothetical protein
MKKVLLIHLGIIQQNRVSIYNYLGKYLARNNISLTVVSDGVQQNPHGIEFFYTQTKLNVYNIVKTIKTERTDAVICFVTSTIRIPNGTRTKFHTSDGRRPGCFMR